MKLRCKNYKVNTHKLIIVQKICTKKVKNPKLTFIFVKGIQKMMASI